MMWCFITNNCAPAQRVSFVNHRRYEVASWACDIKAEPNEAGAHPNANEVADGNKLKREDVFEDRGGTQKSEHLYSYRLPFYCSLLGTAQTVCFPLI
jgi:hypothetical protein